MSEKIKLIGDERLVRYKKDALKAVDLAYQAGFNDVMDRRTARHAALEKVAVAAKAIHEQWSKATLHERDNLYHSLREALDKLDATGEGDAPDKEMPK